MSVNLPMEDTSTEMESPPTTGHVHFPEDQVSTEHELGIVVKTNTTGCLEVHVGFLKIHHHYEISFDIKDDLKNDLEADPLQNLHCKVIDCRPSETGNGHSLKLHYNAHKDKLVKENLTLTTSDKSQSLKLIIVARVLGKHKGTPMYKNGIRVVGVDPDEETDQSDWAGF